MITVSLRFHTSCLLLELKCTTWQPRKAVSSLLHTFRSYWKLHFHLLQSFVFPCDVIMPALLKSMYRVENFFWNKNFQCTILSQGNTKALNKWKTIFHMTRKGAGVSTPITKVGLLFISRQILVLARLNLYTDRKLRKFQINIIWRTFFCERT